METSSCTNTSWDSSSRRPRWGSRLKAGAADVWQGSPNGPVRQAKPTVYEGGIRVPGVMTWPGAVPAKTVREEPISALDLTGTALGAGGALEAGAGNLERVSLLPSLRVETDRSPRAELCWRWAKGDDRAIPQGEWKLVSEPTTKGLELFHLGEDIGERENLADRQPERVATLRMALDAWNAENSRALFPVFAMTSRSGRPFTRPSRPLPRPKANLEKSAWQSPRAAQLWPLPFWRGQASH